MTHNPHANNYPVGGVPWAPEEDATLKSMILEGLTYQAVSNALKGRTYAAVKCRMRFINLSPEDRADANRKRRARTVMPPVLRPRRPLIEVREAVPPEVFEERNLRWMAPRSLTAILMGDPEPGRRRA